MSSLAVLVLAGAAAAHATNPGARFRSVALAGLVGVALGTLLEGALRTRADDAGASERTRHVAWSFAIVYGVVVLLVASAGFPMDGGVRPWLVRSIAAAHHLGVPRWLGYDAVEFSANVVFFVPLGFLLVLLGGARAWRLAVAGGFAGSACIEIGQALFLPVRVASVDDVVANTAGTAIGALVAIVALGRARRRS